jgi:putative ABC transport system permease protein
MSPTSSSLAPQRGIYSPAVLLFSLCATILTTVICGLAPALYALRADAQIALTGSGKGVSADAPHGKLRHSMVVAEVALSIILSICSGLIMRSLFALQNVNLGFNPSKVVYADLSWPEGQDDSVQQKHFFFRKVLDRIAQVPGVLAATETTNFPPYTFGWTTLVISGKTPPLNRNTAANFCTEGYFQTLGLPLLRGTLFSQNDVDSARHVVIVNRTFVRDRFGGENPIGQQVRFSDYETWPDWPHDPYFKIIGVVADAKNSGLQDPSRPEIYLPGTLASAPPRGIMVSTTGNPQAILRQIRAEISAVDPNVAIGEAGTIATRLEHYYYARPRFLLITLCTFATIALLLVAFGVFSVISYTVAKQTHEIGIRIALGAPQGSISLMVLRQGALLTLIGAGVGLMASLFAARLIRSLLYGIQPIDVTTFVAVPLLLVAVSLLASYVPARRATRVDPMTALRYE